MNYWSNIIPLSSSLKSISLLLLLNLFIISCSESQVPGNAKESRDSTITPENSYTKIFIDSMAVERFIGAESVNETTAQKIRSFYNKRNYSYAWFTDTGYTLQAQSFWSVHDTYLSFLRDSSVFHKRLHSVMDTLMNNDSVVLDPDTIAVTEMRLTTHFLEYAREAYGTRANPEQLQWNIPVRKLDVDQLVDSMLVNRNRAWQPLNRFFHRMQNRIFEYALIQQSGGWGTLDPPGVVLKKNDRYPVIRQIKQRLALTKNFSSADTSDVFNDSLELAVRKLRTAFSIAEGNTIDSLLIAQLNIPVDTRLKQMLINLERFKWLPEEPQQYVTVNIPDYSLFVSENGKPVMRMKVIVGKAVNRTVIFSADLKFIVFSPYWNVPKSIVVNEVLPDMRRSSTYLERNNFEITGYSNGLPVIRQRPGPNNALGRVKFVFPNRYNIYLHDTNMKSLFQRKERTFSHGCIRIEKPFDFAKYLLRHDSAWDDKAIRRAMDLPQEKWIPLKEPLRVFVLYITSWVDSEGFVNYRKDIYGHDRNMARVLFR